MPLPGGEIQNLYLDKVSIYFSKGSFSFHLKPFFKMSDFAL